MIVIGLTGSIGMGKSTVAKMLRFMGIPVHDSDRAVHRAMGPDGEAVAAIATLFPEALDRRANKIDRRILGGIVFHDRAALKKLENILHPLAALSQARFVDALAAKGKKTAVLEIPLLFETGAESRVDYTIVVTAPPDIQKKRVMKRKNMSEEKFHRIVESQMPDRQKQARADFVVETGQGYATTWRQLRKILKKTGA